MTDPIIRPRLVWLAAGAVRWPGPEAPVPCCDPNGNTGCLSSTFTMTTTEMPVSTVKSYGNTPIEGDTRGSGSQAGEEPRALAPEREERSDTKGETRGMGKSI
ncbi:unnamed protein product [Calypogeia fissa]